MSVPLPCGQSSHAGPCRKASLSSDSFCSNPDLELRQSLRNASGAPKPRKRPLPATLALGDAPGGTSSLVSAMSGPLQKCVIQAHHNLSQSQQAKPTSHNTLPIRSGGCVSLPQVGMEGGSCWSLHGSLSRLMMTRKLSFSLSL